MPRRATRRGASRTIPNITSVMGRKAIPACSALKLRAPCMNWVRKKNIENMAPTIRIRAR